MTAGDMVSDWLCPVCDGPTTGRVVLRGEHPLPGRTALRYALIACSSCGMCRLDPIPAGTDLDALYGPDYAAYSPALNDTTTYSRRLKMAIGRLGGLATRLRHRGLVAAAADACVHLAELLAGHVLPLTTRFPLSLDHGAAILDYGSGAGGWVRGMRAVGYRAVWAYDIPNGELDALAREGITVLTAPTALPEQAFACIRLEHSLEHVPNPVAVMRDVARALAPGGSAVIALPNIAARTARAMGARWPALSVPHHLSHFTEAALRRLAVRAGLAVMEVQLIPYWEMGYAALRAERPHLPPSPTRAWKMRYLRRCIAEGEGDCIAVRMEKPVPIAATTIHRRG